jgi:hypothetical protein
MAYPTWITPAGNLGIVPEQEYYQFPLDAYDSAGGTLRFFKLSGTLPPGIQIINTGMIQGIPISTAGPDLNQTYTFTIRVQNLSDNNLADRTFNLTITNVSPPVIEPRPTPPAVNVDLGIYFDGDIINEQLVAAEFILGGNLTWTVKEGELPPGVSLSTSGLLYGYINEIPATGPSGTPGWDVTEWDEKYTTTISSGTLGWDFDASTISKRFTFTIQVSDGARTDMVTYTLLVDPKRSLTGDGTVITVDTISVDGTRLTVDTGSRHEPIILTTQSDIKSERQGGWFSFQIQAIDLDGDVLQYVIPSLSQGSFDEQTIVGNSVPYVDAVVTDGNISVGVVDNTAIPPLSSGEIIQVLDSEIDPTSGQPTLVWYDGTVNNYTSLRLAGNTKVNGNVGDYISQSVSSANATIANISPTVATLTLGGGIVTGTISIAGNLVTANIGDYITQLGSTANATVTSNSSQSSVLTVRFTAGVFTLNSGNLKINGANANSYPVATTSSIQYINFAANVGDYITQPSTSANAKVTVAHSGFDSNTANPYTIRVQLISGNFTLGSGNLALNGGNINTYPSSLACTTDIAVQYNDANLFALNVKSTTGYANIAGVTTGSYVSSILSVGVDLYGSPSTQGAGFDSTKFDQGALSLPGTLAMNLNSGWLTGFLPGQISNSATYDFEVQVYKRDYSNYITTKLLTLTVLGDLYNEVTWLTPSYLGTIENGSVSDLSVTAISTLNKTIYYQLTPSVISGQLAYTKGVAGPYQNIPQGLLVKPSGLISGRVSFQLFSLDMNLSTVPGYTATTFDINPLTGAPTTTFDHTFKFSVTAETFDQTASATQVFTLLVVERNIAPYENLYLKALLSPYQRIEFRNIMQDHSIFPPELIYRTNDPWFGLVTDIKTLFLAGLNPKQAADYSQALLTNHFTKRLLFSNVKTAVARTNNVYDVIETNTGITVGTYNIITNLFVPTDFSMGYITQSGVPSGCSVGEQHIKYEVIYVELLDENSNEQGQGPADTINLNGVIHNPYYDQNGNAFVIATPNAFTNMDDAIVNNIGYANKGALPDWMTSIQPNGTQLGFVRGVVLAYTNPGTSNTIAWRFNQRGFDLNEFNFTVDRYLLDNNYSANYDITANAFYTSRETTFDRYPAIVGAFTSVGTVDYAVNESFENINERSMSDINTRGGLDGITTFRDGETIVFYQQEFPTGYNISDSYNQGWSNSLNPWSDQPWDYDANTATTSDDLGWDAANYVSGYNEWDSSKVINYYTPMGNVATYSVPDQRISIWRVNIDADEFVTLSLANVTAGITSITANTTGFGSLVKVKDASGIFVGMPIRATGFGANSAVTAIDGLNITVYPGNVSSITSTTTITCIPQPKYNNVLYVRNGFTHGGVNIYYDPIVKTNNIVPNYSKIPQQIKTTSTVFDGNGTLFYDYRDTYSVPEQGSNYIKFPHLNVFD